MQSAGSKPPSEREPLAGLVERVTFHNADNGFCILCIKARGHRELVTVLGAAPSIAAGEYIQASGTWENNREHGLQFRAAFLHTAAPASAEGMEKYLGSGLIKGIGPAFAQRLVMLVGQRKALTIAVKDSRAERRWSKLQQWLRTEDVDAIRA
jgi:exodeoxyribonuclease V alpha subunit